MTNIMWTLHRRRLAVRIQKQCQHHHHHQQQQQQRKLQQYPFHSQHTQRFGRVANSSTKMIVRTNTTTATAGTPSTAAAPAALQQQPRLVVSRRVYQQLKSKLEANTTSTSSKKQSATNTTKDPLADKPWPQSVLLTGYALAAIFIPYTLTWIVVSNDTLRNLLHQKNITIPNSLRMHFGEIEHDATSYVDEWEYLKTKRNHNKQNDDNDQQQQQQQQQQQEPVVEDTFPPGEYYQLTNELPFRLRKQQQEIEAMEQSTIPVRFILVENDDTPASNDDNDQEPFVPVPASTRANPTVLRNVMAMFKSSSNRSTSSTSTSTMPSHGYIAVEFGEDADGTVNRDDDTNDAFTSTTMLVSDKDPNLSSPSYLELLRRTIVFSTWYHQPSNDDNNNDKDDTRMSEEEVERSRLEYTIQQLQEELKNPQTTRNIDDMNQELQQSRSKLRRLKWKRRLGF